MSFNKSLGAFLQNKSLVLLSELNFADYDFHSNSSRLILTQFGLIKTWRKKSSYQNTKTSGDLFMVYHQYPNASKWYLQGHFYFHWLEIQQVGEVMEKIKNEFTKKQSNSF